LVKKTIHAEITLTPLDLADAFCQMNDEEQAQFFIECATIAKTWANGAHWQWGAIGGHLRDCACATTEARDMIDGIASGMLPRDLPTAAPPHSTEPTAK
jgi:hypothetical protein